MIRKLWNATSSWIKRFWNKNPAWIVILITSILIVLLLIYLYWYVVSIDAGVPAWVWHPAITFLVIAVLVISLILYISKKGRRLENVNSIILVLAALVASPFVIWQITITNRQADIQQQSMHTENYFKAIDNLEHDNILIRTGAIYELGKIAREVEDHHLQIVELLCSYIRKEATETKSDAQGKKNLAIDIQAALDALGRRSDDWIKKIENPKSFRMNLSGIYIKKANLAKLNFNNADLGGAHLEGASLIRAHLEDANLTLAQLKGAFLDEAHLEGAYLIGARLEGAYLIGAQLKGANLWAAQLEGAYLIGAHLQGANLWGAQLEGAFLRIAHLKGADLTRARLKGANLRGTRLKGAKNLTQTQIDSAIGDTATTLPKGLTRPKHWPNKALDDYDAQDDEGW